MLSCLNRHCVNSFIEQDGVDRVVADLFDADKRAAHDLPGHTVMLEHANLLALDYAALSPVLKEHTDNGILRHIDVKFGLCILVFGQLANGLGKTRTVVAERCYDAVFVLGRTFDRGIQRKVSALGMTADIEITGLCRDDCIDVFHHALV